MRPSPLREKVSYGATEERTTNGGDGAEVGKHLYLFDSFVIHPPPPNWITLKGRVRPTPILQMGEIASRDKNVKGRCAAPLKVA